MIFCFHCGKELPQSSDFCPFCGQPAVSPQNGCYTPVSLSPAPIPQPAKGARIMGYLGMALSFIPYTLFAVAWILQDSIGVLSSADDGFYFVLGCIFIAFSIAAVILSSLALCSGFRRAPSKVGLIVGIVCTVLSVEYTLALFL